MNCIRNLCFVVFVVPSWLIFLPAAMATESAPPTFQTPILFGFYAER